MLRATPLRPKTAIAFIDDVMAKLLFAVERVETDNGSKFGASLWLNGKVERSHRINSEQFYRLLEGRVIDDVNVFTAKLQKWEDYYNYHRPHGASRPNIYEHLRHKAQDPRS